MSEPTETTPAGHQIVLHEEHGKAYAVCQECRQVGPHIPEEYDHHTRDCQEERAERERFEDRLQSLLARSEPPEGEGREGDGR